GTHLKAEIVIMRCTPLRFSWRRLKLVEGFAPADHLAVATLGSAADVWSRSSITRKWRSSLSSAPVQPSSWLRRGRNSRRCRGSSFCTPHRSKPSRKICADLGAVDRQLPDPLSRRREDRVGDRRADVPGSPTPPGASMLLTR